MPAPSVFFRRRLTCTSTARFKRGGRSLIEHSAHLIATHHTSGGAHQQIQNVELGGGDVDGHVFDPCPPCGRAQSQPSGGNRLRLAGQRVPRAPQHGSDARRQFFRAEGLREIVVGARVQPQNAILLRAARRQHDDRDGRTPPQLREQFEPVERGQHDVQQDQIEGPVQRARQTGGPVMHGLDRVTGAGEKLRDQLAQAHVVIDNQNRCAFGSFLFHAIFRFSASRCGTRETLRAINNS